MSNPHLRISYTEARTEAWKNRQVVVELQGGRVPISRGTFVDFFSRQNIAGRDRVVRVSEFSFLWCQLLCSCGELPHNSSLDTSEAKKNSTQRTVPKDRHYPKE